MEDFWSRVLVGLSEKGSSQVELAEYIDRPKSTLTSWLTRRNLPPCDTGLKIAEYLEVPLEYLVHGEALIEGVPDPIRQKFLKYVYTSTEESLSKLWGVIELVWDGIGKPTN